MNNEPQFNEQGLLDHFAGLAMQGILASAPMGTDAKALPDDLLDGWARVSYRTATAMLKERTRLMNEKP